jgi:hypothetical protein
MISAAKPKRILVRPKPYYMTIPVLTDEVSEALSRAGRSHGEKYGPDYWKRIRRGERPSQVAAPPNNPTELPQPVQTLPKPEPLSNAVRAKRAKYPPGWQREKLIREYGPDYFREIRKGIRPSLGLRHPRTGKPLRPI